MVTGPSMMWVSPGQLNLAPTVSEGAINVVWLEEGACNVGVFKFLRDMLSKVSGFCMFGGMVRRFPCKSIGISLLKLGSNPSIIPKVRRTHNKMTNRSNHPFINNRVHNIIHQGIESNSSCLRSILNNSDERSKCFHPARSSHEARCFDGLYNWRN